MDTALKTILLVEDEALIALGEKMMLQKYGYRVIIAGNGEQALEMVNAHTEIDLVLMDIDLGAGMDGTRAATLILERHDLPVVFLSSHTEREVVAKTEGITSYGYIVKNSGETVLIASIKMAFRLFEVNERLKGELVERLRAQMERDRQLVVTRALNRIAEVTIEIMDKEALLETVNAIIGETLAVDRVLIYDISFEKNRITGLCEWLSREDPAIVSTKGGYSSLDMFRAAFDQIRRTKAYLKSHVDAVNETFIGADAEKILHHDLNIKSLLWYPLAFDEHGYYLFTINQILEPREWTREDLEFLEYAAKHVSLALYKIRLQQESLEFESELKKNEEKFRSITENSSDGLMVFENGSIIYVSPSYLKILGYSAAEEAGRNVSSIMEIVHPDDRQRVSHEIDSAIRSHQPQLTYTFRARHRLGHYIWREDRATFIYDENGSYIRSYIVARDITERKEAEEEIYLKSLVLDQVKDHVTITDLNGIIQYTNQAQTVSLGYEKEQLIGQSTQVYGEDSQRGATQREIVERTRRDGYWRGEIVNYDRNGTEHIMDCRAQIIYDKRQAAIALCGVATDITSYRKQENELLRRNLELTERAKELNCLYRVSDCLWDDRLNFSEILQQIVTALPQAMQYAELAAARIRMDGSEFVSRSWKETEYRLESRIDLGGEYPGLVEVCYVALPAMGDDPIFLDYEVKLLKAIAEMIGRAWDLRQMSEELLQSRERLHEALKAARAGIWTWDVRTNENYWSQELWELYGLEPGGCKPSYDSWRESVYEDDREAVELKLREAVGKGEKLNLEWRVVDRDGSIRWLMSSGESVRNGDGQILKYQGMVIDITHLKQNKKVNGAINIP